MVGGSTDLEGAFRVGDDLAFRIFGAGGVDVALAEHLVFEQ